MDTKRVIIAFHTADEERYKYLKQSLKGQDIDVADLPLTEHPSYNHKVPYQNQLYQWFIVVRSPRSMAAQPLVSAVDDAYASFLQGNLQGLLAVAFDSSDRDLDPPWSTLRTYEMGTSQQEWQSAADKLRNTVGLYSRALSTPAVVTQAEQALARPTSARRGKPLVFAGGSLAVLVIIGVFFWMIMHLSPPHPSISGTTGTTTVVRPSVVAQTVTPSPTPTMSPQQVAAQNLYKQSITGNPVLTLSSKSSPKNSVWDTNPQGTCGFAGQLYDAKASSTTASDGFQLCMAETTQSFSKDFAYQVQLSLGEGSYGGGLVFFFSSKNAPYYRFALISDGTYNLLLATPGAGDTSVIDQAQSFPAYQSGQSYTLTVIVKKGTIYLYIDSTYYNQAPVDKSVNAATGLLGVYAAWNGTSSTTVNVSDVKAWILP